MRRAALGLALVAAPIMGEVPTSDAGTLTLAEARAMPTAVLVRRVLGLSGGAMRESRVMPGSPPFGSPGQLAEVQFASTPDGSGDPTLCMAHSATVGFVPNGPDGDAPARALAPRQQTLWAFLPSPAASRTLEQQRTACAVLKPVLPGETTRSRFFPVIVGVNGDIDHAQLVLMAGLVRRLAEPSGLADVDTRCGGESRPCQLSRALTGVDPHRPESVLFKPCEANAARQCVELRYPTGSPGLTSGTYNAVTVEADPADVAAERLRPLRITVAEVSWVV